MTAVQFIDETLAELRKRRTPPFVGDPTGKLAEAARNAAIAYTAVENAVLAARNGVVEWAYCDHELTTARLRYPSIDHVALLVAVRQLFNAGPESEESK